MRGDGTQKAKQSLGFDHSWNASAILKKAASVGTGAGKQVHLVLEICEFLSCFD